jgi:hypothetical protein
MNSSQLFGIFFMAVVLAIFTAVKHHQMVFKRVRLFESYMDAWKYYDNLEALT